MLSKEERFELAASYRTKSDEAIAAAELCLNDNDKRCYRAAYNRAWYATMQLMTAATYEKLLDEEPPSDMDYWSHRRQRSLFKKLLYEAGQHRNTDSKDLRAFIDVLLDWRVVADYGCPDEVLFDRQQVEQAIGRAKSLRHRIYSIIGKK